MHLSDPFQQEAQTDLYRSQMAGEVGCVGKASAHNDDVVRAGALA